MSPLRGFGEIVGLRDPQLALWAADIAACCAG